MDFQTNNLILKALAEHQFQQHIVIKDCHLKQAQNHEDHQIPYIFICQICFTTVLCGTNLSMTSKEFARTFFAGFASPHRCVCRKQFLKIVPLSLIPYLAKTALRALKAPWTRFNKRAAATPKH